MVRFVRTRFSHATYYLPLTLSAATPLDIVNARQPEDLFGELPDGRDAGLQALRRMWRDTSLRLHPDVNDDEHAEAAFKRLNELHQAAAAAVRRGDYGKRPVVVSPITIATRRHAYRVTSIVAQGDCCNVYAATYSDDEGDHDGLVKITRDRRNNDLVSNEARVLKALLSDTEYFNDLSPYLPPYKEAFGYRTRGEKKPRQGIAFGPRVNNLFTLREVRDRYPEGVTAKDAAWMFRRLLMVIGFTQQLGYVHGAILPEHVLIEPDDHGVVLIDWKYSVENGKPMTAIPSDMRYAYPFEVIEKKPVSTATDLFMAARCMAFVMGGDYFTGAIPERKAPRQIKAFLRGTALPMQSRRPQDAFELKDEYDELIHRLWGPRRFRPFSMS